MVYLPFGQWDIPLAYRADQLQRVLTFVKRYADHPALRMWGLGDETEWGLRGAGSARAQAFGELLADIAQKVHETDPNHPILYRDSEDVYIQPIRDALPDPKGRYLFLLGRRVHVYDSNGNNELRALGFEDPAAMAINANGSKLAVIGNGQLALYDTTSFEELERDRFDTTKPVAAALFAASDRVLLLLGHDMLLEKPLASKKIISEPICLPEGSGAQIAALASPVLLLFAERRCNSSGVFATEDRAVAPASLYGVDAYAVAYDRQSNFLYTTERAGYLTIYRVPRAAVAH